MTIQRESRTTRGHLAVQVAFSFLDLSFPVCKVGTAQEVDQTVSLGQASFAPQCSVL